jgi:hypothetical protein
MNINELVNYLTEKGFDNKQIDQIVKIQESGYNLIEYIKNEQIKFTDDINKLRQLKNILMQDKYNNSQLHIIIIGYGENINYEMYSNLRYDWRQMEEVRLGLFGNIDILKYCNEAYDWAQMHEIRNGLENEIDITQYSDLKYNDYQMEVLKDILIYNKRNKGKEIDISLFQNEKIPENKMNNLFWMLRSNNQNSIIDAYKQLNEYNEKEIVNNKNNDYEK